MCVNLVVLLKLCETSRWFPGKFTPLAQTLHGHRSWRSRQISTQQKFCGKVVQCPHWYVEEIGYRGYHVRGPKTFWWDKKKRSKRSEFTRFGLSVVGGPKVISMTGCANAWKYLSNEDSLVSKIGQPECPYFGWQKHHFGLPLQCTSQKCLHRN